MSVKSTEIVKKAFFLSAILLALLSCKADYESAGTGYEFAIIPQPAYMKLKTGSFTLRKSTVIYCKSNDLQSYFVKRLEKILEAKGKKLIGWDEILEGGLAPNAAVMSWRGMEGGVAAAKANHHVVMSPSDYAYLDLYQGDPAIEPRTYGMVRLNKVYSFEPVPDGVDSTFILGGQGNLWSEGVPTFRHAEYMLWPRAFALSEVFWSPKQSRDWDGFVRRMETHLQRLSQADINYSRSVYDAIITPVKDEKENLLIQLSTEIEGFEIYYSFDDTYPDNHSSLYNKREKLMIPKNSDTFRVITYRDGKAIGRIITISVADLAKRYNEY